MDAFTPLPPLPTDHTTPERRHPPGCDTITLVLQSGALGAYQAMHEAGLEPDTVAGVSIGSINAAIIAGNPPERRRLQLRDFRETATACPVSLLPPVGDAAHQPGAGRWPAAAHQPGA